MNLIISTLLPAKVRCRVEEISINAALLLLLLDWTGHLVKGCYCLYTRMKKEKGNNEISRYI